MESDSAYLTASLVDSVASIASLAVGGPVLGRSVSFERYGKGLWEAVGKSAAEVSLATIVQKEGEILSYEITDPGKLDSAYAQQALTQLALGTVIGAGLPLLGSLMSGQLRGNAKVMWNSPNELNPTRAKIVVPTHGAVPSQLSGSLADSTGSNLLEHAGGNYVTPGKVVVAIPETSSMTVEAALNWRKGNADSLKNMVNKNATPMEQAIQAVRIKNDIKLAARNAMEDGNAAVQIGMTSPDRTFAEMITDRANDFSGDALYRKVIDDAVLELKGLCFAAGTLIHTKEGLVPIEKIKVGDWVLSQPEETGERVYKRVAKTVAFEDKPVWTVEFSLKDEFDRARAESRLMPREATSRLIVTANHPFWVEGKGWTQVDELRMDDILQLAEGSLAIVDRATPVFRSAHNSVGWVIGQGDPSWGQLLNLKCGASAEYDFGTYAARIDEVDYEDPASYFTCTVYNMEVEDTHTYYVGTHGAWVHNTDCAELAARKNAAKLGSE